MLLSRNIWGKSLGLARDQDAKVLVLSRGLGEKCLGLARDLDAKVRHCGLVVSAPAWDGTGREFDSWQCRIYIPCSLSLRLLGSLRGSLVHMA